MLNKDLIELDQSNAADDLQRIYRTVNEILESIDNIKAAQYNILDSEVDDAQDAIKDILTDLFYEEKLRLKRIAGDF